MATEHANIFKSPTASDPIAMVPIASAATASAPTAIAPTVTAPATRRGTRISTGASTGHGKELNTTTVFPAALVSMSRAMTADSCAAMPAAPRPNACSGWCAASWTGSS